MTIFKLPQWGEKIAKKKWNRTLVWLLRVALGCTFMFSGLTKAIDPWGGFYKFAEYCNVYGFESLGSASLGLSFALAALEFMLGVFVLTGAFRRAAHHARFSPHRPCAALWLLWRCACNK